VLLSVNYYQLKDYLLLHSLSDKSNESKRVLSRVLTNFAVFTMFVNCKFFSVLCRYVYFTFLRDPVSRFLSEYKHVQRGATWKGAKLKCNGKSAAGTVVPMCYSGA